MDSVIEDTARAGIVVQIGFQRRFDAGYRAAREAVAAGSVGRILAMRAATHDPFPPSQEYIAASGGIFRDLHIHDFDAVRFVSGEEVVEVYADGAVGEAPWFAEYGDVDIAAAVLRLSGGGLVIVSGTRHDPLGYDVRLEVFGSADSIAVGQDPPQSDPVGRTGGRTVRGTGLPQLPRAVRGRYESELAALSRRCETEGRAPVRLEEARAALSVALAADRSRAERRPVTMRRWA